MSQDPTSKDEEIILDMCLVKGKIKETNEYKDDARKIIITKYQGNSKKGELKEEYFVNIPFSDSSFIGVVGKELKKNSFGCYNYKDGHRYCGFWKNDKKSGLGVYYYDKEGMEFYIGGWENGKRNGEGIYVSKESQTDSSLKFICIIATFEEDNLRKDEEFYQVHYEEASGSKNVSVYKGYFDADGKRKGKGVFIEDHMIYDGMFDENSPIDGRILVFEENDENLDNVIQRYLIKRKKKEKKEGKEEDYEFEYRTDEAKDKEMTQKIQKAYNEIIPRLLMVIKHDDLKKTFGNYDALQEKSEQDVEELFKDLNELRQNLW